jgi:AraC-like DNA-binding protein
MAIELTAAIAAILDAQGVVNGVYDTPVPGLRLLRTHASVAPRHMHYRPSLCMVAQGRKEVLVGDTTITYGDMQSMIVTVEVPVLSQMRASIETPYVGAVLELNPQIILEVATQLETGGAPRGKLGSGLVVQDIDAHVSASVLRLLDLVRHPQGVEILYPVVMREISYWLLTGPAGGNVARLAIPEGQPARIAKAIQQMRESFDAPVSVPDMARTAGMSASSFHQHFRMLTCMSPLQYQKHLRLLEARRRMTTNGEKAGEAALSVGYESVSQFSREFARMFGSSPRRQTRGSGPRSARPGSADQGAGIAGMAS